MTFILYVTLCFGNSGCSEMVLGSPKDEYECFAFAHQLKNQLARETAGKNIKWHVECRLHEDPIRAYVQNG